MNSDRREAILNYIKERGHASLKELKEIWSGLSEMTLGGIWLILKKKAISGRSRSRQRHLYGIRGRLCAPRGA